MGKVHNELKRAAALQQAFQNALGMKEGGIERGGETLTPTLDLWAQPEWAVLRNEAPAAVRNSQGAIAAEFGGVALLNPAVNTPMLVVVEEVSFSNLAAGNGCLLEMALEAQVTATYAGAVATVSRDRRVPSICRTLTRQGTDPAATLGGQVIDGDNVSVAQAKVKFTSLPVILRPGDALVVICQTVNTAFGTVFKFRERVALPTELLTK